MDGSNISYGGGYNKFSNASQSQSNASASYSASAWKEHCPYTLDISTLKPGDIFGEECIVDYSSRYRDGLGLGKEGLLHKEINENLNAEFKKRVVAEAASRGRGRGRDENVRENDGNSENSGF